MSHGIIKPEQLEGFLGDIERALPQIRDQYRWAYPNAYSRPDHGRLDRTSGGGGGDPVGDLVASTERYRGKLNHAIRETVEARRLLRDARKELIEVLQEVASQTGQGSSTR